MNIKLYNQLYEGGIATCAVSEVPLQKLNTNNRKHTCDRSEEYSTKNEWNAWNTRDRTDNTSLQENNQGYHLSVQHLQLF